MLIWLRLYESRDVTKSLYFWFSPFFFAKSAFCSIHNDAVCHHMWSSSFCTCSFQKSRSKKRRERRGRQKKKTVEDSDDEEWRPRQRVSSLRCLVKLMPNSKIFKFKLRNSLNHCSFVGEALIFLEMSSDEESCYSKSENKEIVQENSDSVRNACDISLAKTGTYVFIMPQPLLLVNRCYRMKKKFEIKWDPFGYFLTDNLINLTLHETNRHGCDSKVEASEKVRVLKWEMALHFKFDPWWVKPYW